jgi:STE24 endopeptidase
MKLHLRRAVLPLCLLVAGVSGCARETAAEHAANVYAAQEMAAAPEGGNLPDYSLPPARLAAARQLAARRSALTFGGEAWSLLSMLLLLGCGGIAWMQRTALRLGRSRWLQCYGFVLLLLLARVLLNLPLSLYGHHLGLLFGLSIERWGPWCADLGKGVALEWMIASPLIMLLFWLIRMAPRRWWLVFWAALVPLTLLGLYLTPLVIDPLFNHFEPLAPTHPALAAQLERMGVPASHQFLMRASAKVTTPNAYVTGLGPSKRVVVWDTTLTPGKAPSPEVLWTVGHECGHYALGHVLRGTLLALAGMFALLWLIHIFSLAAIQRFGSRWGIHSQADWGALAVLLLALSLLSSASQPIQNAVSRNIEHNADIYGEEAIHTLVADPQQAVLQACDEDGALALEIPNPQPFVEFWTYDHPATGRRAAFGKAYNPWAPGMEPKFFPK